MTTPDGTFLHLLEIPVNENHLPDIDLAIRSGAEHRYPRRPKATADVRKGDRSMVKLWGV